MLAKFAKKLVKFAELATISQNFDKNIEIRERCLMASRFLVISFFRGCFGQVLFSPVFDYGFQNGAKQCKTPSRVYTFITSF